MRLRNNNRIPGYYHKASNFCRGMPSPVQHTDAYFEDGIQEPN